MHTLLDRERGVREGMSGIITRVSHEAPWNTVYAEDGVVRSRELSHIADAVNDGDVRLENLLQSADLVLKATYGAVDKIGGGLPDELPMGGPSLSLLSIRYRGDHIQATFAESEVVHGVDYAPLRERPRTIMVADIGRRDPNASPRDDDDESTIGRLGESLVRLVETGSTKQPYVDPMAKKCEIVRIYQAMHAAYEGLWSVIRGSMLSGKYAEWLGERGYGPWVSGGGPWTSRYSGME
jgi:hypothetical protein